MDVEITDFPAPGRPAKGRVIEVLGPPDAFGVDVEIVIRKHHLPHVFPANVLAEASGVGDADGGDTGRRASWRRRRDFRGLPIVTIDGETARDFDDAVLVTPLDEWELGAAGPHCGCEPLCAAGDGAGPGGAAAGDERLFSGPRGADAAAAAFERDVQPAAG